MSGLALAAEPEAYKSRMAALTPGMSGAQIANVCNEAALYAARNAKESITIADFDYAVDRVIAGAEKKSKVLGEAERRIVAYHESGHVLTAWFLEHADPLLKTTIIPRTSGALGFAQYVPSDKYLHSREELEDRLVVMLGGRAAEQVTFGKVTTGASDDLRRVTDLAYTMYTQYGMSESIGTLAWSDFPQPEMGYRFSSNHHAQTVEKEVQDLVAKAYSRSVGLLEEHQDKLVLLSEQLLKDEVLTYEQVEAVIGERPFEGAVNPMAQIIEEAEEPKEGEDHGDEGGGGTGTRGGGDGKEGDEDEEEEEKEKEKGGRARRSRSERAKLAPEL